MSKRRGVKTVYVDLYPTRSLPDFARTLATAVAESIESPVVKVLKTVSAFARDSLLKDELLYRRDDGYVVYDRLFAEWLRA